MLVTNLKTRTSCPIFQNPRPSMVIMVKNGRNNGGRGREIKVSPWMSVLRMGGRRKEGGGRRRKEGFVLNKYHCRLKLTTDSDRLHISLPAQATSRKRHITAGL